MSRLVGWEATKLGNDITVTNASNDIVNESANSNDEQSNIRLSAEEYQEQIAKEIYNSCLSHFKLAIPKSISLLIGQLAALREDTRILSQDEIEWIYDNVIPNHVICDKIYDVSPILDDTQSIAFKKYNSYDFHDCVDEQGPTIFILECTRRSAPNGQVTVIGGYCNVSWFSPWKRNKQRKEGNMGYWVKGSTDCKLFVLRDGDAQPMLAINKTTDKDIMVAANRDGPNFGYNEFYVTANGTISTHDYARYFEAPKGVGTFSNFMMKWANVVGMEVFKIQMVK